MIQIGSGIVPHTEALPETPGSCELTCNRHPHRVVYHHSDSIFIGEYLLPPYRSLKSTIVHSCLRELYSFITLFRLLYNTRCRVEIQYHTWIYTIVCGASEGATIFLLAPTTCTVVHSGNLNYWSFRLISSPFAHVKSDHFSFAERQSECVIERSEERPDHRFYLLNISYVY